MQEAVVHTPLGSAYIRGDKQGITEITVSDANSVSAEIPEELEETCRQLQEYFDGTRKSFEIQLNPNGTPFQKKIWAELIKIPFGKQLSYMDLAKRIGDPKAVRAVAGANAKNPIWILIPCHRVVGSDGSLTGYAGGLHRKKWLLNHESANRQTELFER